ncbi:hypothetical protein QSE00_19555 [Arenibacter sp. M-2]|uniref:hypothetical protein n=1 Tax=Arenibacter sp. M-2 TaxID=3053612 RepID=UPI002570BFBE|nr:hypothetical protein [Arenibacter sp. M-2]MDL5514021.1 hypothetical protein [Arenibacter sp. M-2]
MIESIKHFFSLLFDNSKSWTFRASAGVSIIGFLIITDIILDFSYNLHYNNKLSQLEIIQDLKNDYQSDTEKLNKIIILENKILTKEHYTEFISRNFKEISNRSAKNDLEPDEKISSKKSNISPFWMVFSSNYALVLALPFIILLPLYHNNSRTVGGLFAWFASLITLGVAIAIVTWFAYQIPIILGNPTWNYILNFVIHTLLWILGFKIGSNEKTKSNSF